MLIVLPPEPEELRQPMALDFCRQYLEGVFECQRIYYSETGVTVKKILSFFSKEEYFVFIRPLTIISSESVTLMEDKLFATEYDVIVPALGGMDNHQTPVLPFDYLDIATFEEVSSAMRSADAFTPEPVERIDSALFMIKRSSLESIEPSVTVDNLFGVVRSSRTESAIVRSALAHSFAGYYLHKRFDLVDLVPENTQDLLDVGCGEGEFGKVLKSRLPRVRLYGIEPDILSAEKAQILYDNVYPGRVESFMPESLFDCIIVGDVLEHLYDPWLALSKLRRMLKPNGWFVGSCPNVGHWTVIRGLCQGQFSYIPAGILCFDHIRFFARNDLKRMIEGAGFDLVQISNKQTRPTPEGQRFVSMMVTAGWKEEYLLTVAFNFRAKQA